MTLIQGRTPRIDTPPVARTPRLLIDNDPSPDWRDRAACRNEDPELFFPVGETGMAVVQAAAAKAVCSRCDVVERCLRWALTVGEDEGVWGCTTPRERKALKRSATRKSRARVAA